jgi:hypothetical protein
MIPRICTTPWNNVIGNNWTGNAGLTKRQCRERLLHYLSPELSFSPWTPEEEKLQLAMVKEHGTQRKYFEVYFPGRKDDTLKNRDKLLLRQQRRGEGPVEITSI